MGQETTTEETRLTHPVKAARPRESEVPLAEIEAAIRSVRFGVVQIIIQDGVVVQIDRTEKRRLR
jgi:hypothetical protein